MSILDETTFIERFQFFNGQRLFASDLQGLEEFNREMRWLHNQSLHQPGVGNGLTVNGKREDRQVTIEPGYATDTRGREIILTQQRTEPIPPVAGNQGASIFFDLTVSYPDDSILEEAEVREGVCLDGGVIRLREEPVFCWVELAGEQLAPKKQKLKAELEAGLRIRLARIEVLNCQLYSDVSIGQRQNARPARTPYIVSSKEKVDVNQITRANLTAIPAVASVLSSTGTADLLITGEVNTKAAQFQTTPEYRAHLAGPRLLPVRTMTGTTVTIIDVIVLEQFQITKQSADSFSYLAFGLAIGPSLNNSDVVDENNQPQNRTRLEEVRRLIARNWQVVWMGIEG